MTTLTAFSQELSAIVAKVGDSVVAIHGNRYAASGLCWQAGLIVTSYESVNLEDPLYVTLPEGQSVEASVLGSDPTTDIAVLQLPPEAELPVPVMAELSTLGVGSIVLGLGRSPESGLFASFGIVQTLGAAWRSSSGGIIDRSIRADLTLRRSAAGGPLVDAEGKVIGFNTFGPRRSILTIPASTIQRVVSQLREKGRIARAYLGIGMQSVKIPQALHGQLASAQQHGLMVLSLEPDQAAERAGILLGDILVTLNDKPVEDNRALQLLLGAQSIGQTMKVRFIRGGELRDLEVTVGER
ncbi:S1C family serine protease [Altericista sp. CCNU0014]|uniref:S1C family serine protease n=1 Tax=Altericista sp. CCNU0014 TaxID=3082949 RepID=UPI00384AD9FF